MLKRIFIENVILGFQKLSKDNINYLKKTLRFQENQEILVFDGEKEGQAIIVKDHIEIIKIIRYKNDEELNLAISIIKKERIEWLIEKACEIGVQNVFLLKTERTQNDLNIERLKKIAIEAAKQSGRISIPQIFPPNLLNNFIKNANCSDWCFGSLKTTNKIQKIYKGIIIGPEGGWSDSEEILLTQNFDKIYLNKNILRAETAAISGLTILNNVL